MGGGLLWGWGSCPHLCQEAASQNEDLFQRHSVLMKEANTTMASSKQQFQAPAASCELRGVEMWVWFKIKPPGYGPRGLVHVATYQGKPLWVPIFDPQPCGSFMGTYILTDLLFPRFSGASRNSFRMVSDRFETNSCFVFSFFGGLLGISGWIQERVRRVNSLRY